MEQAHIEHRNFIDDDEIRFKVVRFVIFKDRPVHVIAIGDEKAVYREGISCRRFRKAFCRPSCRCAEHDVELFLFSQTDNGLDDGGLAGTGSASNDE